MATRTETFAYAKLLATRGAARTPAALRAAYPGAKPAARADAARSDLRNAAVLLDIALSQGAEAAIWGCFDGEIRAYKKR